MYKTILVAIGKGPHFEQVSDKAIAMALQHDAKLIICHVKKNTVVYSNSLDPTGMMTMPHVIQDHSYSMMETFEQIKKEALIAGVREVETIESYSSEPGIAIAETIAQGFNTDLIICGKSEKSRLKRLFKSDLLNQIVNYAVCDVLIVRNLNK